MSAIITNNYRHFAADLFYEKVYTMNVSSPSENDIKNLYFFIGRPKPWDLPYNDINPTPPNQTITNEYECHVDMLALKRLDVGENLSFVAPRYDWVSGIVYAMYDNADADLYNHPSEQDFEIASDYLSLHPGDPWTPGSYYVVTDEWEVYLCLYNGIGPYGIDGKAAKSTVKPSGGPQAAADRYIVETSDGYKWKYLFTISQSDIERYVTDSWIPVKYLTSNDGSDQWLVQNLVNNNGSIDIIKITNNGDPVYWYGDSVVDGNPTTFASVTGSTTLTLVPGNISHANDNNMYDGCEMIAIPNNPILNLPYRFVVNSYNSSTYTVTISTDSSLTDYGYETSIPVEVLPADYKLYIAPRVFISGNVTSFSDICIARTIIDLVTDEIKYVQISEEGVGYRFANVEFLGYAQGGSSITTEARAIIPPIGGHGANPKIDLGAWYVMLNTQFSNNETDFPTLNDYRRMGLIRDVQENDVGYPYSTAPTLRACKTMELDNVDLSIIPGFQPDELIEYIVGLDVITSAYVIEFSTIKDSFGVPVSGTNPGTFKGLLSYYQDMTTGFNQFTLNTDIIGNSSTIIGTITALNEPEYLQYSGKVLYIEQRRPIIRAPEQVEAIKIILEF